KCLEKDRTRRYETVNGLAADTSRFLNQEPIIARPPSAIYRFRKTWHRNRLGFSAGAAVLLALLAGFAVSTRQAIRATRAERQASEKAESERKAKEAEASARLVAEQTRVLAEQNATALSNNLYFNRIALAHRELTSQPANVSLAEKLLDECPERLRN